VYSVLVLATDYSLVRLVLDCAHSDACETTVFLNGKYRNKTYISGI